MDISPRDAKELHDYHIVTEKLSYRAGSIIVVAALVTAIALIALVLTSIYSLKMEMPFPKKILAPSLISIGVMIPLFIKGGIMQSELTQKRSALFTKIKEIIDAKQGSVKELTRFIEENILQNCHDTTIQWHRTYITHIITEVEKLFPNKEDDRMKALEKAKTNLTERLKKSLGGDD